MNASLYLYPRGGRDTHARNLHPGASLRHPRVRVLRLRGEGGEDPRQGPSDTNTNPEHRTRGGAAGFARTSYESHIFTVQRLLARQRGAEFRAHPTPARSHHGSPCTLGGPGPRRYLSRCPCRASSRDAWPRQKLLRPSRASFMGAVAFRDVIKNGISWGGFFSLLSATRYHDHRPPTTHMQREWGPLEIGNWIERL